MEGQQTLPCRRQGFLGVDTTSMKNAPARCAERNSLIGAKCTETYGQG